MSTPRINDDRSGPTGDDFRASAAKSETAQGEQIDLLRSIEQKQQPASVAPPPVAQGVMGVLSRLGHLLSIPSP